MSWFWIVLVVGLVAGCKPASEVVVRGDTSGAAVSPIDVSRTAAADVGQKRILPKGRSLVKLRSLQNDVQVFMPEFGNCIVQLQKQAAVTGPRLTVEMRVDAAGKVTSAIIAEASQSIPEFETCILEKARALVLPEGTPDRVLRLPFDFSAVK